MKNAVIVVLAVLFAAAGISELVLYGRYGDVKESLEKQQGESEILKDKLSQVKTDRSGLAEQLETGEKQLKDLKRTLEQLEEELEAKDQALFRMQDELKVKNRTLPELEKEIRGLKKALDEENSAKRLLEGELVSKDRKIADLHSQIDDHVKRLERLEQGKKLMSSQLKEIVQKKEADILGLKNEITSLERRLGEEMGTRKALEGELAKRKARIEDLHAQIKMNGERLKTLEIGKAALARLQDRMVEKDQKMSQLQNDLRRQRALADDLKTELASGRSQIEKLKNRIALMEDGMDALRRSKETEVTALKKELSAARRLLSAGTESLRMLEQNLEGLKSKTASFRQAKNAELTALERKLEQAETLLSSRNERITDLEQELELIQAQAENDRQAAMAGKAELERKLEQAETLLLTRTQSMGALEKELDGLKAEAETFRRHVNSKMAGLTEKLGESRTRLSAKNERIADLEKQLRDFESQMEQLYSEISNRQIDLEGVKTRVAKLQDKKAAVEHEMVAMKNTYDRLLSDLKKQLMAKDMTVKQFKKRLTITFVDRILFDFARTDIRPKGKEALSKVGDILKTVKGSQIRVIGHTDNVPISPKFQNRFPTNWELSAARASSVVRYLQQKCGLDPAILRAVGRSFFDPVADNGNEEGRAQNRRVEIILAPHWETN